MSSFPRMHVSLYVSNIAETVSFYDRFFGQQAEKVKSDYAKYVLDKPSLIISFVQNPERVQSGFGHLGFQVETEEQLVERLNDMKLKQVGILEEMGTNCCYAMQDKFWVNDPDGHQWEVYYFHQDAEFNDPKFADSSASACCMPPAQERPKQKIKLSELNKQACEPGSGCC